MATRNDEAEQTSEDFAAALQKATQNLSTFDRAVAGGAKSMGGAARKASSAVASRATAPSAATT